MKATQKIQRIERSIKLQEKTRDNLASMMIDNNATVELCERIIANLKGQLQLVKMELAAW